MARFTDTKGRAWLLTVTVGSARRVRTMTGVDLVGDFMGALDRLKKDSFLAIDVVWALVEPEARRAGVTPEAFADAANGSTIEESVMALIEALADFFPSGRRALLRRAAKDSAMAVEELDKAFAKAAAAPGTTGGSSSGSSPASAASIPPS